MHRRAAIRRVHRRQRGILFLRATNIEQKSAYIIEVGSRKQITTGDNIYPMSRPQPLHLLDKYTKIAVPKIPTSEGLLFSQGGSKRGNGGRVGGNKRGGGDKPYDKNYWKDK